MNLIKLVEQFNKTAGVRYNLQDGLLSYKDFVDRNKYMKEEQSEYMTAYLHKNKEEVLDALIDQMYILIGTAERTFGASVVEEAFRRVHENNMSKFPATFEDALFSREAYNAKGVEATIHKSGENWVIRDAATNKILKPVGFQAVELGDLVEEKGGGIMKRQNLNEPHNPQLNIGAAMPRFFVDERVGCIAIRDRHHPDFDVEHQGLDADLPDIVKFKMGTLINNEWVVSDETIEQFKSDCAYLNIHQKNV